MASQRCYLGVNMEPLSSCSLNLTMMLFSLSASIIGVVMDLYPFSGSCSCGNSDPFQVDVVHSGSDVVCFQVIPLMQVFYRYSA